MKKNPYHNRQGERKEQLLVLVDKNGKFQGKATREECHRGMGKTHLAFIAFIVNSSGELLLTKRSKHKSLWPLFWDAATISHVLPGETVEQAANRRGKEELGVDVDFKKISSFFYTAKYQNSSENEYCYIMLGKTQETVDPNPLEISEYKLLSLENLLNDIRLFPQQYTPWLRLALNDIKLNKALEITH